MNAIGIVLLWCMVQITLVGLAAGVLYTLARRFRPAAAAPVVVSGLGAVLALSLLAPSPWPRWTIASPPATSPLPHAGEGPGVRADRLGADGVVPPAAVSTPSQDLLAADGAVEEVEGDLRSAPVARSGDRPQPEVGEWPGPDGAEPEGLPQPDAAEDVTPGTTSAQKVPVATILWQAIVDELSPPPAGADGGWRWPAVLAVLVLAAAVVGLAWFGLGVAAVRRQIGRSRPVADRDLAELVDVVSAELGCWRSIEIRESDELATAATIGWRRPVVLLPGDWREWTVDQRRAVLAHEIAHARRHDFLALLFGQLALVLHFYNPMVHWLMGRLRLEQELAADDAAADISGGRREYLATLAELALRQADRPLPWPAQTFLPTRTTFLRRIAMLRDTKIRPGRLSPVARLTTVCAVVLCGFLAAGLRGPARESLAMAATEKAESDQKAAADTIVEGVGWGAIRIGMERKDLLAALGKPDDNSSSDWLKWQAKHMECTFHKGDRGVSEIRFNPGSQEALKNGLKVGSPAGRVERLYGKPEHTVERGNGAKEYEYSSKGVLFWTHQGKVTQIVVFKPYGGDAAQLSLEGWQLWQKGRLAEAAAKFRQAVKLAPNDANAWNGLGWASFNSGDRAEAEDAFKKVIALDSDHPAGLNGLGQLYLAQKKYDAAEDYLLKAAPQAPAAWFGLARLYLLRGEFEKAETWAEKAVDSGQGDDYARQMLEAAKEKHLSDELRQTIEPQAAGLLDGGEASQLMQQGWALWQKGQSVEAAEKFRQAVKLAPNDANAWNGLGWANFRAGNQSEAENAFKRAVAFDPNHPAALNGLGQVYLVQREYDRAEEHLLKAAPQAPAAWWALAKLYLIRGQFDKAQVWAQKIVDSSPDDTSARRLLEAAKEKYLDEDLRSQIEPSTALSLPAQRPTTSKAMGLSTSILANSGVEEGGDQPDGWTQGAAIPGVTYSWDKGTAFQGKASLFIEKTADRYFPIAQWSQTVDRTGDAPALQVSAQVKAENMTKATLDVIFYDKNDKWISHKWAAYIGAQQSGDPPANHDWKEYSGTVEIPDGTAKICVALQDYGPGKVWFDDVQAAYVAAPAATGQAEASPAEARPAGSKDSRTVLSHVGDSSTDMRSFADSGFAEQFERPAGAKSIAAVEILAARYGYPKPPNEDFHIYLLDENRKVLEEIRVPYGKVERGDLRWYTFDFPAVAIPEKFYVALWFDAERTKGIYVGMDKGVKESHSWIGLPDRGFEKVKEPYDWMIRAVVSDEKGKEPSRPKVTTYGEEKAADTETTEALPTRTWTDATGAFKLEAALVGVKDGNVQLKKVDGTVVDVPLDRLSKEDQDFVAEQEKTPAAAAEPGRSEELSYDDGKMAGRSSIAGGGHAVEFEVDGDSWYVTSVSLHGSRYGEARPPKEDFNVWICDDQFKPIATFHFPYSSFTRSKAGWKSFRIRPTRVPSKFIVCFAFNPHQTKGVMVSYDAKSSGHSMVGVPGETKPRPFDKGDWLIRCKVVKRASG